MEHVLLEAMILDLRDDGVVVYSTVALKSLFSNSSLAELRNLDNVLDSSLS